MGLERKNDFHMGKINQPWICLKTLVPSDDVANYIYLLLKRWTDVLQAAAAYRIYVVPQYTYGPTVRSCIKM
jgi:hypothetical protein